MYLKMGSGDFFIPVQYIPVATSGNRIPSFLHVCRISSEW